MRFFLTLAISLSLAACGSSKPTSSAPPPTDTTNESLGDTDSGDQGGSGLMTAAECEAAGGTVVGDIGDGSVHCDDGWTESGNVSGGVEQQLCCTPAGNDDSTE
jgi:hypothetical protein